MSADQFQRGEGVPPAAAISGRRRFSEEWQLGDIHAGTAEPDSSRPVGHEKVSKWLKSWGKPDETKAPR
jgi:predicted transcriptional regulator